MIKGKVARILSDSEVVLNVASKDGVKLDMDFVIYSESDHIFDPTTSEDLGAIETVKGRITVTHVMEKMSRAETSTYKVALPSLYEQAMGVGVRGLYPQTETRRHRLEIDKQQPKPLKDDLTVKIGDPVRSVESH